MNNFLYESKKTCNICNKEFNILKVKSSKLRLIRRDDDLCPYYKDINPLSYEFHVCPHCSAAFTDSFPELNVNQKDKIRETFKNLKDNDFSSERDINTSIRAAKLALLSAIIANIPSIVIAGICTRIAWFYRYIDNNEEEKRFLSYAYNKYNEAYNKSETKINNKEMSEEIIVFLLGEFSFRTENYENTKHWFNTLFSYDRYNQTVKKGRDRWLDIKPLIPQS